MQYRKLVNAGSHVTYSMRLCRGTQGSRTNGISPAGAEGAKQRAEAGAGDTEEKKSQISADSGLSVTSGSQVSLPVPQLPHRGPGSPSGNLAVSSLRVSFRLLCVCLLVFFRTAFLVLFISHVCRLVFPPSVFGAFSSLLSGGFSGGCPEERYRVCGQL